MAEVKVRYNNLDIAAILKPGGMTLLTAGKYMGDNVLVLYTDPNPNVIQDQDGYVVLSDLAGSGGSVEVTVTSAASGINQCVTALLNAANAVAGKTYVINAKTLANTSTNVLLKAAYVALVSISSSSCTAYGGLIRNTTSGVTGNVAWGSGQCVIVVGDIYTVTEVDSYPVL